MAQPQIAKIQHFLCLVVLFELLTATQDPGHAKFSFINGDFIIGALLPMRHRPSSQTKISSSHGIKCGTIREDYGIQRAEVALQTIDKINSDPNLLPNITLGLEIRDDCWYAPIALQQSIEFIRDEINPTPIYDTCSNISGAVKKVRGRGPLLGVVGPGSSSVALQVQNLLQLFYFSQIGFSTTSRDLSDKNRFGYFLRVVPSDYHQAQVILDIVRYFGWTYVSVVNTDENYGQSGIQAFRELALKADICIAVEDSVLSTAADEVFDNVINNLRHDLSAGVVVCFCEGLTVQGLLRATKRLNVSNQFLFIGSDGWADRVEVTQNYEEQAWGGFSIRIHSPRVDDFDPYYFSLKPYMNNRNPWFNEFWEQRFNCTLAKEEEDQLFISSEYTQANSTTCSTLEDLSSSYRQDSKLSFVCKAIYTLAYALHNMQQDVCGHGFVGVCPNLTQGFNRSVFKNYLMNVSFMYNEDLIEFDENGDPPGRYEILNYQKLENGKFDYVHVGDWNNRSLTWNHSINIQFGPRSRITSVCSQECSAGQYKAVLKGGKDKRCCWNCLNCEAKQISNGSTEYCETCPEGFIPDSTKMLCRALVIEHIEWTDTQAIVAMAFAILGILLTSFTFIVFVKYNKTPVVKSSTKELSYIILAGMLVSHSSIFVILTKPTTESCALSRFLPGVSFAMIYAALLTKTNRIARILSGSKKRFPTKKPLFMSATAQVVITCLLIGIEVLVSFWMFQNQPPKTKYTYTMERAILQCDATAEGIVIPLAYDFILIVLCTIYALKTRNVPENFNEAKFIGFCMYTTCVIWIAFVPIYFESDAKVITLCLCITFCALETWAFLFIPKMYIIILRPERNNRSFFTTSKTIRCHIGSRVASAIAEKSSVNSWRDSNSIEKESTIVEKSIKDLTTKDIPQKRTLSCQTGAELLQVLLNPKALMESCSPTHTFVPRITEIDCCETDTCHLKKITIKLPSR